MPADPFQLHGQKLLSVLGHNLELIICSIRTRTRATRQPTIALLLRNDARFSSVERTGALQPRGSLAIFLAADGSQFFLEAAASCKRSRPG